MGGTTFYPAWPSGSVGAAGGGVIGYSEFATLGFAFPINQESLYSTALAFPNAGVRIPVPRAGTLQNLRARIDGGNTLNASLDVRVAINGVDSGLTLTIPAATSGSFLSAPGIAVAAGDRVSFHIFSAANAGVINDISTSVEYLP